MNKNYIQVYARNCIVVKIDKTLAKPFLTSYHLLGYTKAKHFYGIFVKRKGYSNINEGTLVAVAGFSGARRWQKQDKLITSYEWVRFACLPNTRIAGGMGKILAKFIEDFHPHDIMTYVDINNSFGDSYIKLGFVQEDVKTFPSGARSLKLRLKLTPY